MRRLHSHLASKYQARAGFSVHMPANGPANAVVLEFEQKRHLKAIGHMVCSLDPLFHAAGEGDTLSVQLFASSSLYDV